MGSLILFEKTTPLLRDFFHNLSLEHFLNPLVAISRPQAPVFFLSFVISFEGSTIFSLLPHLSSRSALFPLLIAIFFSSSLKHMSSPRDVRRGKLSWNSRKEGSKDPNALQKGCVALVTFNSEMYSAIVDRESLSLILLAYCVSDDFELELPSQNARINDPPLDHLGVYEEALEAGL